MSEMLIGLIGFIVLFALLLLGLPIGVGMILVGFGGLWAILGGSAAWIKISTVPFNTAASWDLSTLPLFILMANVLFASGLSKDLFDLAYKWLGRMRGGVAVASIAACGGFAAVSASSIATAATIGNVAIPEMKRFQYSPSLTTGSIAAGGTLGSMIPPSGTFIIYGMLTETSISKLFMAGLMPGLLQASLYIITIIILCSWRPTLGPKGLSFTIKEKFLSFSQCFEIIALIIFVLGGLLIGWFTPTEAGAAGAFGAVIFSSIRRRINWQKFKTALVDSLKVAGMIYGIMFGAFIFNFFVAATNIPYALSEFIGTLPLPPLGIMALILSIYIILGCIIDTAAMITLTIPIFFPLAIGLGFSPIWFGVMVCLMGEVGMITPPIGMNVFVISGLDKNIPMQEVFKGIFPFLAADVVLVIILLFLPGIALFLPNMMS